MRRSVLFMTCAALSALCGTVSGVLAVLTWRRAGLPYNEEGHYFDGLVNHHQQAVLVYAMGALLACVLALGLAWAARRIRQR
jgi:cobalamin synthase